MSDNEMAPVALFVHRRLEHTRKTLESLRNNVGADKTPLYIFSDGARCTDEERAVESVRSYLKQISGFASVEIVERDKNWGLADSIVDGVSKVIDAHGRVIVIEDDIVTKPHFLKFMNKSLDYYEDIKRVMHISGWSYPISDSGLGDVFLWRGMNCWGWATWKDRWKKFNRDIDEVMRSFSLNDIENFNFENSENMWAQLELNKGKKIKTWAIFWYASIYKCNGLSLNPTISYVENIGFDGTGENCGNDLNKYHERFNERDLNVELTEIEENSIAFNRIKKFYTNRNSFKNKIVIKFKKILSLLNG